MALTKASDILGLEKKVKEIAVPIGSLSASKVTVDLPGFTSTNAAGAFEELDLDLSALAASVLTIGEKINNINGLIARNFQFSQPYLTINADTITDFNCNFEVPTDEVIIGCAAKYAGLPEFVLTNTFIKNGKDLYITILNPTSSSHTSTGDIVFTLLTKKNTTETKKRTTKKRG